MSKSMSRRAFAKTAAATAVVAGAAAFTGCSNSSSSSSTETATEETTTPAIEISDEVEPLTVVTNMKDTKIAPIIIALNKNYFTEEKLTITESAFGNGFQEIMPALSKGDIDVLPFGSIPTCTYVSQGDDLVIFGGTVLDGSECITLAENKNLYKKAEDFKGKRIGCFPMETGHMATKSWLSQNGLNVSGTLADGADVEFVTMGGSQAEVEGVKNGEIDMCFVNSGYGYTATQDSAVAVAFRPNELIGHEFPCCRQSTNRNAYENKKSALVKFEIAVLRGLCDINTDKEGTIGIITAASGQPEEYVEATMYSTSTYTAAMKFEMDPMTDDVKVFYSDMIDNGTLENTDKDLILQHMDSVIYKTALDTLIARGENLDFYNGLLETYTAHNTLGL